MVRSYAAIKIPRYGLERTIMADPAYFLSGPPQMIQAFKMALLSGGTAAENICIDEWE